MRLALLAVLLFAAPSTAAERMLTVTDFDGVRVEGPFVVTVSTGRGSGGRLSGSPRTLDHVRVDVVEGTAIVRATDDANDATPARVMLVTRSLARASLAGPGNLTVDRMTGDARVTLEGAGMLSVDAVAADRLTTILNGTGTLTLAGAARDATLEAKGSGSLDAARLTIADAKVVVEGSATLTAAATRSASLAVRGAGSATVSGKAACTVKREGSGTALCGKAAATPVLASAALPRVRVGMPPSLRPVRRVARR